MTPQEREALDGFVAAVQAHYGPQLHDILVFGSRARGDNRDDSDIDLAIIFEGSDWDYWSRKFELLDMGWDAYVEANLDIEPWPVTKDAWDHPDSHRNPRFIRAVRQDAISLAKAA
jgi:predicted nucleotidyltransferase